MSQLRLLWWCLFGALGLAPFTAFGIDRLPSAPLSLTAAEKEWLAAHPVIRVGLDPSWPPFSAIGSGGRCVGIDVDLLQRIGAQLGIRFECYSGGSWEEVYAAAARRDFDLLAGTAITPERQKEFAFTEPYFRFPVVIVTRNDEPLLWSLLDLEGRELVGVRGYAPTSELQRKHPELTMQLANTVEEAMNRVAEGEADAFVSNLPNVSFVAKTRGLTNLKIAGVLPDSFDMRYAVRPDWPVLRSLLDRAILSLSEAERQAIVHPWIRVDYAKVIRWDIVWRTAVVVLTVFAIVIGAIGYHNRRLARELEQRIRLQRRLEESHAQLERLNEEKTEMLQMAAHDLRGPLTGIQLVMDASLRMNAVPKDDALNMVDKQVGRMTALLGNLLDADELEHGRREFRCEPVEAAEMLRAAVAAVGPAAAHKSIRIDTTDVPTALRPVQADPTALRQIMDNLLSNAVKYSPRETTVRLILQERNQTMRLEVRDEGPGVAAHETERIFVKYARGSARPTGGEKSTGLGLAIVRQLATAMNARVWCEHRSGEGGYFVLALPLAAQVLDGVGTPESGAVASAPSRPA